MALVEEQDPNVLTNHRILIEEMMPVALALSDAIDYTISKLPEDVFIQLT